MKIENNLSPDTLSAIRNDWNLLTKIGEKMNVKPETVLRNSFRGSRRFLELPVLEIISATLNTPIEKLIAANIVIEPDNQN